MPVRHASGAPSGAGQDPSASGRHPDGTFATGNVAAVTHGAHARQVRGADHPDRAATRQQLVARKRAAILDDLGGEGQLSQLQRDLVDRYLELDIVASWLGGHLTAEGPLSAKGRTRAALSAYVTVVDRVHRIAAMLGLRRAAKRVSLPDYLTKAYGGSPDTQGSPVVRDASLPEP